MFYMFKKIIILVYLITVISGCAGDYGWRVSFGISPVNGLDDQQTLQQTNSIKKQEKY